MIRVDAGFQRPVELQELAGRVEAGEAAAEREGKGAPGCLQMALRLVQQLLDEGEHRFLGGERGERVVDIPVHLDRGSVLTPGVDDQQVVVRLDGLDEAADRLLLLLRHPGQVRALQGVENDVRVADVPIAQCEQVAAEGRTSGIERTLDQLCHVAGVRRVEHERLAPDHTQDRNVAVLARDVGARADQQPGGGGQHPHPCRVVAQLLQAGVVEVRDGEVAARSQEHHTPE